MTTIAPDIFRKRLLIEGFYTIDIDANNILEFFAYITKALSLRTYGEPIVHQTSGAGKEENQGYDAFVPLIDSGIYLCIWANQNFLSLILYTCTDFNDIEAIQKTDEYFRFSEMEHAKF